MGFQDIYTKIAAHDGVKVASAQQATQTRQAVDENDMAVKTASFYDGLGRQLAHRVFGDLVENAEEQEHQAKVAHVLNRMGNDPAYAAELVRKHGHIVGG